VPRNLVTTFNRKIDFRQEMSGQAEIITEDLSMLERLFYQFRRLVNNPTSPVSPPT
jgi:hypothetical protein